MRIFLWLLIISLSQGQIENFNNASKKILVAQNKHTKPSNKTSKNDKKILQKLLLEHEQWKQTPYKTGGTTKSGADCSGFVMSVFSKNFDVQLPRMTIVQMQKGKEVAVANLKSGDLVFFMTQRGSNGYHVGIYLENGNFLHLSTHGGARIANLSENYWKKSFIKAVRYL